MATVKPISPNEVNAKKADSLPNEVIEAFNELIAEKWNGSSAIIKRDEAVKRILEKMGDSCRREIDIHWLDVEPIYRENGWYVNYNKPAYNESYEGYYTFNKPLR